MKGIVTCVRIEIVQDTDNTDRKVKWFLKFHTNFCGKQMFNYLFPQVFIHVHILQLLRSCGPYTWHGIPKCATCTRQVERLKKRWAMLDNQRFNRAELKIIFIKVLHNHWPIEGLLSPMREAGSHRIKIQISLAIVYPVNSWKRVSSKTFNFMKMENFLKMEKISYGKYLTISLNFVRFCKGTFRLEEAIYKFEWNIW